tara:strand:+ start:1650 stop:1934 length:285 start_codon:yes stop_codon:yes gene_type:complete
MSHNLEFVNFMNVNKSQFDSCDYYQSIKPENIKDLASALEAGTVKLNKNGNVEIKGWINKPKDGGAAYISLKWSKTVSNPEQAQTIDLEEDIPF